MVIITLYHSNILLSLHYFLTPQFQTYTNLLIGIFGVSNYFFLKFLRNYVSIIVNIISNNTVLQCYFLWIFVSIKRLLQLIVCTGVSTPPPTSKTQLLSLPSPLLNLQTTQTPLFRQFPSPPPKKFSCTILKKNKQTDFSVNFRNSIILTFFIINPILSLKSN